MESDLIFLILNGVRKVVKLWANVIQDLKNDSYFDFNRTKLKIVGPG